jgi:hypothetical protein
MHQSELMTEYCTFGKLEGDLSKPNPDSSAAESSSFGSDFIPTRRVRDPPGGKTSISFLHDSADDALAAAPAKTSEVCTCQQAPSHSTDRTAILVLISLGPIG